MVIEDTSPEKEQQTERDLEWAWDNVITLWEILEGIGDIAYECEEDIPDGFGSKIIVQEMILEEENVQYGCPFCELYYDKRCRGCPIRAKEGWALSCVIATPYGIWSAAHDPEMGIVNISRHAGDFLLYLLDLYELTHEGIVFGTDMTRAQLEDMWADEAAQGEAEAAYMAEQHAMEEGEAQREYDEEHRHNEQEGHYHGGNGC